MKNRAEKSHYIFNLFNSPNSSIIASINLKEKFMDSNVHILNRVGYEDLNFEEYLKMKNENITRNSSYPNIRKENKSPINLKYKFSTRSLIRNFNLKNKKFSKYILNLNNTSLKSYSTGNCLSPSTISSTINNSTPKNNCFLTAENFKNNRIKNIKNCFLQRNSKYKSKNLSYITSRRSMKAKSDVKISKKNLIELEKKINETVSSSKLIENDLEKYLKKPENKKRKNKQHLYHDFNEIKNFLLSKKEKKRIKTCLFNQKTGRTELMEINNANLIKYCDNVNHMKEKEVNKWGNKIIKKYRIFERNVLVDDKKEKEDNGESLRKLLNINTFKLKNKLELIMKVKKKIL